MRKAVVTFRGLSPYSASKVIESEKAAKEGHDDFEKRTWKERLHVDGKGHAFIPPMAFKKMLDTAASRFPEKIKGRGQATYTKHFVAGVLVTDALPLPGTTRENVKGEWLFVPSDGKPGGNKRVKKCFPVVHEWGGDVVFHVLDETVTETVFEATLAQAFAFVGIGRFRPERGGFYGRCEVVKVKWQ